MWASLRSIWWTHRHVARRERRLARAVLPETKARLAEQVDEAIATGIFGAPSFMVGDELFWGNDRLEQAIEWTCRPNVREVS
jgi:2-hydroxychromene-2-carboxylate isomerase